ncbi:hypothetical protein N7454_004667 [Penicillium verhagenii]|nr:hypothetical protein N7454_004667 [Penicillium verhagenii]
MMLQIPTPPASRSGSEAPEVEVKPAEMTGASSELLQSLDVLLEQYLHLLDRQQELQSGLAKQLSSGFLALAHANYTCPPGRRYGADYYDERMKATRKISIQNGPEDESTDSTELTETNNTQSHETGYLFNMENVPSPQPEEKAETNEESQPKDSESKETPQLDTDATAKSDSPVEDSTPVTPPAKSKSPKKTRPKDPIHWYGILVPPSLRTAQKSFTGGISNEVPALAAVVVEMRTLEDKINKLRAEIGG